MVTSAFCEIASFYGRPELLSRRHLLGIVALPNSASQAKCWAYSAANFSCRSGATNSSYFGTLDTIVK
jgi:hypothetical protein